MGDQSEGRELGTNGAFSARREADELAGEPAGGPLKAVELAVAG